MSLDQRAISPRVCEVCGHRDKLLRCSGCQASWYCGQEHQVFDRPRHKKSCGIVKKARLHLEQEEQKLRDAPGDIFTPPNIFENGVGHFWGIHETRPYMRARYGLVDVLLQVFGATGGRVDVVQTALDHLLDMLRLCRGDNMGVRDIVPALYIRLRRDQEAYDFVKWYATTGQRSDYDWGDTDLPFLDVKNADVLEPLAESWSRERFIELSHTVSVMLIKVLVLLDLQAVQNTHRALRGTLPQEMIDLIRDQLVGNIVESRPEIFASDMDEITSLIQTVKGQIEQLFNTIQKNSPTFWATMLDNPAAAIADRPSAYSPGSPQEACLIIGYNYAAWAETTGAIQKVKLLRDSLRKNANDDDW